MLHLFFLLISTCSWDVELFVSGYVVEKCEVDSGEFWERLPKIASSPSMNVKGLTPGKKYKFRVRAENMYGLGEPAETSQPILAKNPYGLQ